MKLTSHPSTVGTARLVRRFGALIVVGWMLALSACGFGVQTLHQYTPADGVNVDVGLDPNGSLTENTIKVRGLMILAQPDGSGFLSASFVCAGSDELTEITGMALTPDGSEAGQLTVELPEPIEVADGELVNLIDREPIIVTGDLTPGLDATLTLTFDQAGSEQVRVPIVDGSDAIYESVSPSPAPSEG